MSKQFYQVGGSLPANSKSYIKREADDKLYSYLKEGKYCYVLNARQTGKSSLRVRTSKRLEESGYSCVNIDLTSIGSDKNDITTDTWYFSFLSYIVEKLGLDENEFVEWWDNNDKLTVVNRFAKTFDKFVLEISDRNIVIFIDEVDYILGIKKDFSTDDFFAVIRTFYNLRSEDERYNRVTFALFGVATPEDLMQDSTRTPFNIAHSIKITPFKLEESFSLIEGLENQSVDRHKILEKIFEWTGGTPYLTQKILEDIAKYPITNLRDIDNIINRLFIKEGFNEINLSYVQERIIKNTTHNVKMLYTIKRIQNGEKIKDNSKSHTHIYLKLSGLIKEEDGLLVYSNQIYQKIFNASWLDKMIDKLDRPIAKFYHKWIENGKSKRYLLKKETLQEITKWAQNRSDLLAEEYNYLSISQQEESRKFRMKLEKEAKELRKKILEEQEKYNRRLIEEKKRLLEEQKKHNRLLEEEKKINYKLLEEQKKFNRKILRLRQVFAVIISTIIGSGIYIINKNTENAKIELENAKLENELRIKKLEKEKIRLKLESKKKDNYYKELLEAKVKKGTLKYYLWEITTYRHLDNNQTNYKYKIAEDYTKIGDIYKKKNNSAEAKKNYQKAIDIYKEDKKYQKELAYLYYKMDNIDEALKIYEENPEKYKIQRAKLYYEMVDKLLEKDIEQAEDFYIKGFKIYRELLQINTNKYIDKLAYSLIKKAKISLLKGDNKEAKSLYIRALNIYKKLDKKLYRDEIENIEKRLNQLNKIKVNIKKGEGWVYIGKFSKEEWEKQYFWLDKPNTLMLKNCTAIAVSSVYLKNKPLPGRKYRKGDISLGNIVTIKNIKKYQKEDGIYIWAYIKY